MDVKTPVRHAAGRTHPHKEDVVADTRKTLTVEEAARLLGIGRNAAYEAVHRGEIPHLRIGRRLLVPRAAMERLLAGCGDRTPDAAA